MDAKETKKHEAVEHLREYLKEGDTVYTILGHVSQSGMFRKINCYVIRDNEPRWLTPWIGQALGWKEDDKGVHVSGCGMDMGFHLVYTLSCVLFCPDKYDHDKAYSLKQRWM